ncbi:MAG: rod shape-determining protein MreD [Bacteroidales bacterium]|nr:rod shape-determining protein MreD [Bacteroidales bacterium]
MDRHTIIQNILRVLLLLLLQLIVLDNVSLSNILVPNILILFVLMLPTSIRRIPMLLIAFATGLLLDICSNLLGVQALSFTVVAMARILFADRLLLRNEPIDIERPSIKSVTFQQFALYSLLLLIIYFTCYILLEVFSFHNIWMNILAIVLNVAVSWVLIIIYQLLLIHEGD